MSEWTTRDACKTYNILHWGGGYYDIDAGGYLCARPDRDDTHPGVNLYALARDMQRQGLSLPLLVRFPGILRDRVDTLCGAFAQAMDALSYTGGFTAAYPIKVNQQRRVVEDILHNNRGRVGLEAGSKPELLVVMALSEPGGIVICNGYKDREYIRLALIGRALGLRVHIVVEKRSELALILQESRRMGVAPLIGVRVRLSSLGAGKWQNTGGEKAKFGLSSTQLLEMVEHLRTEGMLDALQLLHCHMGSQIANIQDIQRGMRECARYFAELCHLGAPIGIMDVGGGLGVDYEGTRSRSFCSMNYNVQDYANNVMHSLWTVCEEQGLVQPHVISESGRALTAHHAVLIVNVIDVERTPGEVAPAAPVAEEPPVITHLREALASLQPTPHGTPRSALEVYHDAVHWLGEAQTGYTHGVLGLAQRAQAERIYFAICWRVRRRLQPGARAHREVLDALDAKLADKYFCNFSLFQSLPDVWAIDQIFPVVPLHRLDEAPTRRAVLEDITCDSDGRIDHYVDAEGIEASLPLHAPREGEPYLLGLFMIGAYQEILGDMHNLFGDTNAVHVEVTAQGHHKVVDTLRGDTVDAVLDHVHFDATDLMARYQAKLALAALDEPVRARFVEALAAGLQGYTYLED